MKVRKEGDSTIYTNGVDYIETHAVTSGMKAATSMASMTSRAPKTYGGPGTSSVTRSIVCCGRLLLPVTWREVGVQLCNCESEQP